MNRVIEEIEIEMGDIHFIRRIRGMNKYFMPFLLLELKEYIRIKKIAFDKEKNKMVIKNEPFYTGLCYAYEPVNYKNIHKGQCKYRMGKKKIKYEESIVPKTSLLRIDYWELISNMDTQINQLRDDTFMFRPYKVNETFYKPNIIRNMTIKEILQLSKDNGFNQYKIIKKIVYKGKPNQRIEYKKIPPYYKTDKFGNFKYVVSLKDHIEFLLKL